MKRTILSLILCMAACNIYAQHTLTGVVKDGANGEAVAFATVALMAPDSSIVTGVTTGDGGLFKLENVRAGNWIVRVSFIGYEKTYRTANVPQQSDLGEIQLSESANRLNEVIVTATRPFVEQRVDRYVVNVGSHILTAGRNALDVLRNTPGVLVRPDGSITVMGNAVAIWIDGRPSRLSGEQLNALLTSTQGETIDRIEVITNPSSRYDAAGTGGIINIRTKQGLQYGLNGSVNTGASKSRSDWENAGLQLNYRNSAMNLFGNYGIVRSDGWQKLTQVNTLETPEGPVTFDRNTEVENRTAGINHQYRLDADFFLSPDKTLGVLVNSYYNGNEKLTGNSTTQITPVFEGVDRATSRDLMERQSDGLQANINYRQTFAGQGQQLDVDIDYGHFGSNPSQHTTNSYYAADNIIVRNEEQLRHANPQRIDIYSGKLDYTHPVWENGQLEAGFKSSGSKTDNDLLFEEYIGGNWETDRNQTNHFIYTEQVHAAYLNLSRSWGKWSAQAGLRGEYTVSRGEQRTAGAVSDSSYFDIFPTLFVNYSPDRHTFGLSYSRRLSRPSYSQLNPFEIRTDAYSYIAGNPALTPAYIHNIQLSYSYGQSLMTRLSYNRTSDMIVNAPVVKDGDARLGMIPVNFGRRQSFTGMANYRLSPVKWWTVNLMGEVSHVSNRSGRMQDDGYAESGLVCYLSMNNSFTLPWGLSAELSGMYLAGQKAGYLAVEPMGNVSAGIRKSFLDNSLTVSLNASDLFYTMNERVSARYGNVDYKLINDRDLRAVSFSVRYSFGSQTVKSSRSRSSGIEEEARRAR